MKLPKRVLIFGGTHGNEWTGIKVVEHFQDHFKKKYPDLQLEFILANPEAYRFNRRCKDEDLNRAFQFLNEDRASYENQRAKELKKIIDEEPCLVLDLHTTTSNMGRTVIVSHYHPFNLSLCAKLSRRFNDCRIIGAPDPDKKYLASQSERGLILELGPVANGIVEPAALEGSLELVDYLLELLNDEDFVPENKLEMYEESQDIYYPKNERGEINAYIHSGFQGKDFSVQRGSFTPFRTFQGQEIQLTADEELYPIFINEAAYYPQQLAFTLCRKRVLNF